MLSPTTSLAASDLSEDPSSSEWRIQDIEETTEPNYNLAQPYISGNEPSYTYWYQSKSKYKKTTYGAWQNKGVPVHGPINLEKKYTSKTSVSITASAGLPIKTVEAALTGELGKTNTVTTTVSRYVPKGKKGQLQVRNVYKHYNVTLEQWMSIDGRKTKTGKTKVVTVKRKSGSELRINVY